MAPHWALDRMVESASAVIIAASAVHGNSSSFNLKRGKAAPDQYGQNQMMGSSRPRRENP